MEQRKLPKGELLINPIGLGMGCIQECSNQEIYEIIRLALDEGINFFDLCAGGKNVYEPFGRALKDSGKKAYFQVHFGAVYKENGEYGWSRNLKEIKETFEYEMKMLQVDNVEFGFLHCIDDENDLKEIIDNGVLDYVKLLKEKNIVKHIGFSSHTPSVANKLLDMKIIDMMMFSINPAYDLEKGDEYGIGSNKERVELFKRCERENVGISVMKPYHGGQLLDEKTSPFNISLTKIQCLQYCLDRPGVLCVVPGIRNINDLKDLLKEINDSNVNKDYSIISKFAPVVAMGNCVYCNHCQPCPKNIDIGLINKYYDLAKSGDKMAKNHYDKLAVKADECMSCGHCNERCPFKVNQQERMKEISKYFNNN